MMKQLQVAASEAEGRQDVLAAIQALDAAVAEMEWLSGYEDDPNKYKVGAWRWPAASPLTKLWFHCLSAPGLSAACISMLAGTSSNPQPETMHFVCHGLESCK